MGTDGGAHLAGAAQRVSMDDLRQGLMRVGFSQKEASVYLACLQLGKEGANAIARKAGVQRPTCYHLLQDLCDKGLVTAVQESGERRFLAEPPQRMLTYLHMQAKELEERRRVADDLMLRLQVFHNVSAAKPKIRYIESWEGLRAMQREYERLDEEIIQLIGYDTFYALHDHRVAGEHQRELAHRKRRIRSILITDRQLSFPEDLPVEFATISPNLVDAAGEMTVCGERLVLFSFTNGVIAIEIASKSIAETARAALELAWRQAKQINSVTDR